MPTSDTVKVQQDSSVILTDGGGTDFTIPYVDGAGSIDGINYDQTEPIVVFAKRSFLGIRRGAYRPVTFSFTAYMSEFTSATATSLVDFVRFQNAFSGNTSRTAGYDHKVIRVRFQVAAVDDDGDTHQMTMDDCQCDIAFGEGEPNQFTLSGTCYGGITVQ